MSKKIVRIVEDRMSHRVQQNRLHPIRSRRIARGVQRFVFVFAAGGLLAPALSGCRERFPAIEVFNPDGDSSLTADPYLIVNFGDVDSTLGISKNVTVRNIGEEDLQLTQACIVDTGIDEEPGPCTTENTFPYAVDDPSPRTLAPDEEITINIVYTPTFAAPRKVLRINSNDPDTPVIKLLVAGSVDIIPGSLSGCICNDGVGWVEGAEISVAHEDGTLTTTTDSDGCFLIEQVPSGLRVVEATSPNYSESLMVEVTARKHNSVGAEECDSPTSDIVGCVCDEAAFQWVVGGEVRVDTPEVGTISTSTDANGCFVLQDVPVGMHTVTATGTDFSESWQVTVDGTAIAAVPSPLVCEPPTGSILGCPCDESVYAPVPGASIVVQTAEFGDINAAVDADGCFLLEEVPFGNHTLTVTDPGGYTDSFLVTVEVNQTTILPGPAVCASCAFAQNYVPEVTTVPVDVIFVIDNSGSMNQENQAVTNNLNTFSQDITGTGLDHRVITIGRAVAPAPLGGGPNYRHIDTRVRSHDALLEILGNYGDYDDFLRSDSKKHIIAITDDSSQLGHQSFTSQLNAFNNPGFGDDWVFHSIVAYGNVPQIGCPTGAGIGNNYLTLTQETGGYNQPICNADFSDVFTGIFEAVTFAGIPCIYALDAPPNGSSIDPNNVDVTYTKSSGTSVVLPRNDACNGEGWRFDNPGNPSSIELCPASCDQVSVETAGGVDLGVGCIFD